MEIRTARRADIPELLRLLWQVNEVHHRARPDLFRHDARKYGAAELEAILAAPESPVLCAAEGERLLGYAFCLLQRHPEATNLTDITTLYLDDLCVDEAARRQGVGRQLFAAVKALAAERGCHNLTLNVWAGNESALAFYATCGLGVQKTTLEYIVE